MENDGKKAGDDVGAGGVADGGQVLKGGGCFLWILMNEGIEKVFEAFEISCIQGKLQHVVGKQVVACSKFICFGFYQRMIFVCKRLEAVDAVKQSCDEVVAGGCKATAFGAE